MELKDIDDIELIGGALRVPKIMEYIQEIVGRANQKLNLDEAASFGAGFLSASLANSFRVKPIYIALQAPFEVMVRISQEGAVVYEGTLMKRHEEYTTPLIINITTTNKLLIELFEEINGEKKKFEEINAELVNQTEVNTTMEFTLTSYGTIKLSKMLSVIPTIVQKNATVNNESTKLVEEVVDTEVSWNYTVDFKPAGRMTVEERKESIKKLDALDEQELIIKKKAHALNDYESLIYSSREWLNNDDHQKYIIEEVKVSLLEILAKVIVGKNK
jgi:molecular chaperone DnaK (HSP70)